MRWKLGILNLCLAIFTFFPSQFWLFSLKIEVYMQFPFFSLQFWVYVLQFKLFIFRNFEWTSHNSDLFPEIFWVCNFHFSAFGILNFSSCNSNISFLSYNLQDVHLHFKKCWICKTSNSKTPPKMLELWDKNVEFWVQGLQFKPFSPSQFRLFLWYLEFTCNWNSEFASWIC